MTNREWQPIETAPKDGTRILVTGGALTAVVQWEDYGNLATPERPGTWAVYVGEDWVCDGTWDNRPVTLDATHWMPLPEPPSEVQP